MASVKDHYDHHLAHFYEWMAGDFITATEQRKSFYTRVGLGFPGGAIAIDLGCGHGIDSVPLCELGYKVVAIDFNEYLLNSLRTRVDSYTSIDIVESNFVEFRRFVSTAALIVCMGDTLAHLGSTEEIKQLFKDCCKTLNERGKLVVSFRDYGIALNDTKRFIPVKSDDSRILTCFLEFQDSSVLVTDILYEKENGKWVQKTGQYTKLRLTVSSVEEMLSESGFYLVHRENVNGLFYLVAEKSE